MINATDSQNLRGLTDSEPRAVPVRGKVLLHNRWFVLELEAALSAFPADIREDTPYPDAENWRARVPPGEGEYAQGVRTVNQSDGVPLVKLISDSGAVYVHPSIYDLVLKKIAGGELRTYPGNKALVGIYSNGSIIGLTATVNP